MRRQTGATSEEPVVHREEREIIARDCPFRSSAPALGI